MRTRSSGAATAAQYVNRIDAATNTLTIGRPEDLLSKTCMVDDVRYVSGTAPPSPFRANVKVRSHASEAPAWVRPLDGHRARIEFDDPQRALAPGQAAVFYDAERVIGGGPIAIGEA